MHNVEHFLDSLQQHCRSSEVSALMCFVSQGVFRSLEKKVRGEIQTFEVGPKRKGERKSSNVPGTTVQDSLHFGRFSLTYSCVSGTGSEAISPQC